MTTDELKDILQRGEGRRVEFKLAWDGVPVSLFPSVAAMLNREGGVIVLGVDDQGTIIGINPSCLEQMKKDIVTSLNNPEIIQPPVNLPVYQMVSDGATLLCLKVPVSSQVHFCKGVIYDRENDSDLAICDDTRISDLYFRKRQTFSESEILKHLRFDDFDKRLFDKTRAIVSAADHTHSWVEADDMTILRTSQLYRRDPRTGDEGFTLASALIFGKDDVIQSLLPGYKVDVLVRIVDLYRYDDRLAPLRTNLIDTYQLVMEFLKSKPYLPEKFFLEGDQRKDLRELIFREIVGNMIVHREYTSAHTTELVIYKDRVEVTNPNNPLFKGILSPDSFSPFAKNPTIRKFFAEFGWTDEQGSGIKNVTKYLKIYTNGASPIFIEDDKFRSIIPLSFSVFGNKAPLIFDFAGLDMKKVSQGITEGIKQLPLDVRFSNIEDPDVFLFQKGSSWAEKGGKLAQLRINKINTIRFDDFQKGGSWAEKGGKLLSKRTLHILRILILCVELLIIDKPNSPDQKYKLTRKGKLFLGGFESLKP